MSKYVVASRTHNFSSLHTTNHTQIQDSYEFLLGHTNHGRSIDWVPAAAVLRFVRTFYFIFSPRRVVKRLLQACRLLGQN
jgi:hypothetical protein